MTEIMKIYAVIISYNPNVKNLENLIKSLLAQKVSVILVDNASTPFLLNNSLVVEKITLSSNSGIAKAQNIGIRAAMLNNAEYIIFFDQDSSIENNFIKNIHDDYLFLKNKGINVGAIGPRFIDERFNFYYKALDMQKNGLRKKIDVSNIKEPIHAAVLISSGSFVEVEALNKIGLMRENYFIDYVDTEWCIRAESLGFENYISSKAVMKHAIGDDVLQFKYFNVPVHSPFRRYYRVRNAYYLFREPHVPILLTFREIFFNFIHQTILVLYKNKKKDYIKSYLSGLKDGLFQYRKHNNE